jgi:mRNA interferase MazF
VKAPPIPRRGDLVWLDFSPQSGREQAGRRPALILSPEAYNRRSGLAIACPVTSRMKGYPFEVALPAGGTVSGAVLVDHLRSIDWRARNAARAGTVGAQTLAEVGAMLAALLSLG